MSYCQKYQVIYVFFTPQAHDRIMQDIRALRSSESKQLFKNLRAISSAVVENGGLVSPHPLGF